MLLTNDIVVLRKRHLSACHERSISDIINSETELIMSVEKQASILMQRNAKVSKQLAKYFWRLSILNKRAVTFLFILINDKNMIIQNIF